MEAWLTTQSESQRKNKSKADFQDLEAERTRSSQLETQRQELEAPSIDIFCCADFRSWNILNWIGRSFLVWWRLGLNWLNHVEPFFFRHLSSPSHQAQLHASKQSVEEPDGRFTVVSQLDGSFCCRCCGCGCCCWKPGTNGCTGRSKCSCGRSWQIFEGQGRDDVIYPCPMYKSMVHGCGKLFLKAVRMFARKKGVKAMSSWKIPENFGSPDTGKRREMSSFVAFWQHLHNQCTNRYPTSLVLQWNYTYTLQQSGLRSHMIAWLECDSCNMFRSHVTGDLCPHFLAHFPSPFNQAVWLCVVV